MPSLCLTSFEDRSRCLSFSCCLSSPFRFSCNFSLIFCKSWPCSLIFFSMVASWPNRSFSLRSSFKNCSFSLERSVSICLICFCPVSEDGVASENLGMNHEGKKENRRRVEIRDKRIPPNTLMECGLYTPKRIFLSSLNMCDWMDRNKALNRS